MWAGPSSVDFSHRRGLAHNGGHQCGRDRAQSISHTEGGLPTLVGTNVGGTELSRFLTQKGACPHWWAPMWAGPRSVDFSHRRGLAHIGGHQCGRDRAQSISHTEGGLPTLVGTNVGGTALSRFLTQKGACPHWW